MAEEIQTDDNVLDEVFANDRDRGSNDALPDPEPLKAETPEARQSEPEGQPRDHQAEPDANANRHVPLSELLKEREKFKTREEELRRESAEREKKYLEALSGVQRQTQPREQPQRPDPIDPFVDPEGAMRQMREELMGTFEYTRLNDNLNLSERFARQKHGDEAVQQALQSAINAGIADQFRNHPDAYEALVTWHKRETAISKVGTDVDAYEKRIREEERQRVLAELKQGGTQSGSAAQVRLPGTLTGATPAGGTSGAISDEALLNNIFANDRNRKAS